MLDRKKHEYYIKRILRDIVSDKYLNSRLSLKGGTCLYLFYDLPRFSVDLDFNLLGDDEFDIKKVDLVLRKHLDLDEGKFREYDAGWLWEASYEKGQRQFQIDINRRQYPDKYVIKQFYGLSISTMSPDYMMSHKLCAITDRSKLQNRDLFDSWFMFDQGSFGIIDEIIVLRTGKSTFNYLEYLMEYIGSSINRKSMLQGLGELLDERQKEWVKYKLVDELVAQIEMKRDSL